VARELLYPVLDAQTYARLGIASPAAPLSRSGTPYLTGTAVQPAPGGYSAPGGYPAPGVRPAPGEPPESGAPAPSTAGRDRAPMIIATATAMIVLIIIVAAAAMVLIERSRADADPEAIRAVVSTETAAYNDRDFDALLSARCASDRAKLQARMNRTAFAAAVDASLGSDGRWEVQVQDIAVDRDAGTATAMELSTPIVSAGAPIVPQQTVSQVAFRKESGHWLKCTSAGTR
jgi:hypothetical protein